MNQTIPSLTLCAGLVIGVAACDGTDAAQEHHVEQTAHELDESWTRTAQDVVVADELPEVDLNAVDNDEERAKLARLGDEDPVWRSADGERYDALFVLPDGTAYGRFGEAPLMERPTEENDFGMQIYDEIEQVNRSRIWTDTSIDDRYRVSSTTTYPSRTIGALSSSGNTQSSACTASKVGPRALLTAAHCIMDSSGNITTSGRWNPGQTNTATPNGSFSWSGAYLRDYRNGRQYDYAILFLEDDADAVGLGWLGIAWWNSESSYTGKNGTLRGYPCGPNTSCGSITVQKCKASPRSDERCDGWMYGHTAAIPSGSWNRTGELKIDNDASSGQSGSPVYRSNAVLGVYWGSLSGQNYAARFRSSMWNDVCGWIASVPSAHATHSLCN